MLERGAIARHRHAAPYLALVLSGGYEEAGDAGRFRVTAGDVLVHGAYSAHCDLVGSATAVVLNLSTTRSRMPARGRINDPDLVARLAERDPRAATAALEEMFLPNVDSENDEVDALAALLICGDVTEIGSWAATSGRCRETISRRFRMLYGTDAATFRAEARARRAWRLVTGTGMTLSEAALASGHADQAHMTRSVKALTGATPGAWRRVTSVQEPKPRRR